jgi:hypothetical protein
MRDGRDYLIIFQDTDAKPSNCDVDTGVQLDQSYRTGQLTGLKLTSSVWLAQDSLNGLTGSACPGV